jgi:DNA-binding NarL/FixJ family response regulator
MITIVVVDDQSLIRDGVAALLGAEPDFTVVGTAADGAEAVGLISSRAPDVALMDIRMPDMDGVEATRRLVDSGCATKILILTTYGAEDLVLSALRAGASGYLLKDTPRQSLAAAVRSVATGEATLEKEVLAKLVANMGSPSPARQVESIEGLSAREVEVLGLVGRGESNSEIAELLCIQDSTVKTHVSHIQAKLDARDRVQLVVLAHRAGLV